MGNWRLFLLTGLLLISAAIYAREWTPDDDVIDGIPIEGAVNITSQSFEVGHLKIHYSDFAVKMDALDYQNRKWTLVTIDGETRLWDYGRPALPMISRTVRLPNKGNVQVVATPGEYVDFPNVDVMPQQLTDLKQVGNHLEPLSYKFDQETYNKDCWYPENPVQLSTPQIMRDARATALMLCPVQYNPVTRVLRVYRSYDVETIPTGGVGENELELTRSHAVPSYAGIYSDIIGADELTTEALAAPPGKIMLVCRSASQAACQAFADWKTQSGHPTQLYVTATTVADTIRAAVLNAYNTWNPPLETVLLMGDGAGDFSIPTYSFSYVYSDHNFGCLGTSVVATIWTGRLHADNAQELQIQINKSVNYERNPPMGTASVPDTTWFTYGWGYAGTSMNIVSNPPNIQYCLEMMRSRGVRNTVFDTHNGHVDASLINTRLNNGAIFWAHRAGWIGEINQSDVTGMNNINKPFVGFNITCSSGDWFGTSASGIHVALTKMGTTTQGKGALAAVSTQTSGTNPGHNNVMSAGSFHAYGVKKARQPGPMFFEGKYQLWRNYIWNGISDSSQAVQFIYWNNPLGDLSVNMWSGVPRKLLTTTPRTMGLGQNRLELTVTKQQGGTPVAGAMVTAFKRNATGTITETYARAITDTSGHVLLTLNNATAGSMFVTVSTNQIGQNLYPKIDTVSIVQRPVDLSVANVVIQDDNNSGRVGNNNLTANPGETIDLTVSLQNRGSSNATGITGSITSTDPRVTVGTATATWPTDSAGSTVAANAAIRISLLNGFKDNEVIPLRLGVITDQDTNIISIPITVRTIKMAFVSYTTTPAVITPGQPASLSITVKNSGGLATASTNVSLFTLSPYAAFSVPTVAFPSLPLNTNVSNPTGQRFTIVSNGRTIPGTIVTIGAAFSAGSNIDTVYFTMAIGTRATYHATGPDPYGYMAFDKTDTSYRMLCPTYQWVEILPASGGHGTRLALTDNVIASNRSSNDVSLRVRLPFTVRYYGANYDSATICSNGWLAFGSQPNYQNSRNWHLPAFEGPRNIVAVNWCDQSNDGSNEGTYVWNDTANHRYIVTWKNTSMFTPSAQEYQLIIFDPRFNETATGDASLKFQYKVFNPAAYSGGETGVSYATVGICDSTYTRALEYCYWNMYNPGCAPITNGSNSNFAIMFTTSKPVTGHVGGLVTKASDNTPIRNAVVALTNGGRSAITDSNGHYSMRDVQIGAYNIQATCSGYNAATDTLTVVDSLTTTVNFHLTAPRLVISLNPQDTVLAPNDSLVCSLPDTGDATTLKIYLRNRGNGPLTWNSELLYGGVFDRVSPQPQPIDPRQQNGGDNSTDELNNLWDRVYTFDASAAVGGDQLLNGVEFDGLHMWITGATNGYARPHKLYKLTRAGQLLATYDCPDQTGLMGWRDMAWDGHYLYGSYSNYIDKIDTSNGSVVSRFQVQSISVARGIAIDTAAGIIYYADQNSAIYKMHLSDGTAAGSVASPGGLFGLAWYPTDPDNMPLYAFCRDSSGRTRGTRVYKINPTTGTTISLLSLGSSTENANGLAITPRWNPMLWTSIAMLENPTTGGNDHVVINELAFNTVWIQYSPHASTLEPGAMDSIQIHIDSHFMPIDRYRVAIRLVTNSVTDTVVVPVVMNVYDHLINSAEEPTAKLPAVYALEQNYPNPFNPTTAITFALPRAERVKLSVYNELGQEVVKLVSNRPMSAGMHSVTFDGSKLATGLYFYKIEAGSFVSTRKMVLLK